MTAVGSRCSGILTNNTTRTAKKELRVETRDGNNEGREKRGGKEGMETTKEEQRQEHRDKEGIGTTKEEQREEHRDKEGMGTTKEEQREGHRDKEGMGTTKEEQREGHRDKEGMGTTKEEQREGHRDKEGIGNNDGRDESRNKGWGQRRKTRERDEESGNKEVMETTKDKLVQAFNS